MFLYFAGAAFLLILYSHAKFLTVAVDRIYPECFRKCKYGGCGYYKEFYDPISHKTKENLFKDLKNDRILHAHSLHRKDYDHGVWGFPWDGKVLKNTQSLDPQVEFRRRGVPESKDFDDFFAIGGLDDEDFLYGEKIDLGESSRPSLSYADIDTDLKPLV